MNPTSARFFFGKLARVRTNCVYAAHFVSLASLQANSTRRIFYLGCTHNLELFPVLYLSLRKEVIQPHLPVRLPCYDFTPLTKRTFDSVLLAVRLPASGTPCSDGVTGGVYKARERIHRTVLMCDY